MQANRGRDTAFELRVRREVHRRGMRYRVDYAPSPEVRSRADLVFPRFRVAVYLDGCFWHGCALHGASPKTNSEFWSRKFERNRQRDLEVSDALEARGWTILRFWEHETPYLIASRIEDVLGAKT